MEACYHESIGVQSCRASQKLCSVTNLFNFTHYIWKPGTTGYYLRHYRLDNLRAVSGNFSDLEE
eukprot:426532-Amorphochlora_amoeboformis.AAC.1